MSYDDLIRPYADFIRLVVEPWVAENQWCLPALALPLAVLLIQWINKGAPHVQKQR
jgi:hypothetical protein